MREKTVFISLRQLAESCYCSKSVDLVSHHLLTESCQSDGWETWHGCTLEYWHENLCEGSKCKLSNFPKFDNFYDHSLPAELPSLVAYTVENFEYLCVSGILCLIHFKHSRKTFNPLSLPLREKGWLALCKGIIFKHS